MAGTLTISTLSDGTNSTSSTNCIQGSAKAWANWAGASGTVSSSYNVSSVTRNSTGVYTVNFTNAFADTKYVIAGSANATDTTTLGAFSSVTTAYSTSSVQVHGNYVNNTTYDYANLNIVVFR